MRHCLFFGIVFLICGVLHAGDSDWMANFKDTELLSQLSIPGTHDSGALYEPFPGTAKCQNLTIAEQLNIGVRFIDIRCRHIDNSFTIHHGSVYQNLTFQDVLNTCNAFLDANPTETIIMSVKEEYDPENNTRPFEQTFVSYVNQNFSRWFFGTKIPTLGQVRGKIVLFKRFVTSIPGGLDATAWADDTSFSIGNPAPMRVQDNYNCSSTSEKWTDVSNMLAEAQSGLAGTLYVNFSSGYTSNFLGIPSITNVSNSINPQLSTYFSNHTSGRYGAILMDFVNDQRAELIYSTNFQASDPVSTKAYWRFEEFRPGQIIPHQAASGVYFPDIKDYSGNSNNLSVLNSGTSNGYITSANVAEDYIPRIEDNNLISVKNTGSNPTMFCGNSAMRSWNPASFTFEATIKFQSGGYRTYIGRDSYGTASVNSSLAALYIQALPSNALAFKFCDNAGSWHEAISADNIIQPYNINSAPYADDVPWYSIAAISDGDIILLYLYDHSNTSGYQLIAQADISSSNNTALSVGLGSGLDWQHGDFTIGRGMYDAAHADRGIGYIDEVRISDGDRDISQLLYSPSTKSEPVAWYKFQDNLNDSAGTNHGISPGNSVSFTAGAVDSSLSLNGIDQYVVIPRSISNSFSIAFWVRTSSTGSGSGWWQGTGLVDAERPDTVDDFGTSVLNGKFAFGIGNPDTTLLSTSDINDNRWHHCLATRDSTTGLIQVFVDGRLENSVSGPTGSKTNAANINIGRINTGINYTAGAIDEVRLYDYALSADEAADISLRFVEKSRYFLPMPGDINGDMQVNFIDLQILCQNWLSSGIDRSAGDLADDNVVDLADFEFIARYWYE